jgi:hypothetical protein
MMKKAKLIKKQEMNQEPPGSTPAKAPKPPAKRPAEIVREWIGHRQQSQPSARQAFAALFGNPEPREMT